MAKYIDADKLKAHYAWWGEDSSERTLFDAIIDVQPAADVVEVRQIRAFIDRLVAERDKYDLHSMCWERYNCDRLLIEQMLDEIDGGVNT